MKIYFSIYVLIFSVFISNSALAYKTPCNKMYYKTGRIDFIIIDTIGADKPATKKEQQADYLTEIWSHTDDMKPKELVKFMEGLITELRQKQANKNLKIQLDAIKALHEQFENEIPGFGGNQPNVCDWKDRLASTISALAPDSEIAEYEITSGVNIGSGSEKSRKNVSSIVESAQKTKGVFDEIAYNNYLLTGSTAGFNSLGKASALIGKAQGAADLINKGKDVLNKIAKACKEGADIKDIKHGIHADIENVPAPPQSSNATAVIVDSTPKPQVNVTEITIENATELSKWKSLTELLNSQYKILEKSSADGIAHIRVQHDGSTIDQLADLIDSKLGAKYSVKDIGGGKMRIAVR